MLPSRPANKAAEPMSWLTDRSRFIGGTLAGDDKLCLLQHVQNAL
jgi:hypothetical protein